MSRSLRVGDAVLLKVEKTNKLSSSFCPCPLKVVQKTASEVTLRNENGVELTRNSALLKKYNEPESASVDAGPLNAHQGEIQESPQTETGKGGDECEPQVPEVCEETLRWSTRQIRRPSRFNPFPSKGFPIDEQNRLALDREKSISALAAHSAVKELKISSFIEGLKDCFSCVSKTFVHEF